MKLYNYVINIIYSLSIGILKYPKINCGWIIYPSISRILLVTILINQWDIVINQRVLLLHPSWSILTLINPQPSMSDFIGRYLQIHCMPRKWCGVNALWPSPCNLAIFDMFDTQKDTPWCTKNLVPSWVKMELECACFLHMQPFILENRWFWTPGEPYPSAMVL